jgi:hypothetical protein
MSAKQTISTQETYEGILSIDDVKPIIKANTINFPVAVEVVDTDKYHGDARSFGYPVDEGYCTVVTFEPVIGAIVDDTIAALKELRAKKELMSECMPSVDDYLEQSDDWNIIDYKNMDLSVLPAIAEYKTTVANKIFAYTENNKKYLILEEKANNYRELNLYDYDKDELDSILNLLSESNKNKETAIKAGKIFKENMDLLKKMAIEDYKSSLSI